MNTARTLKKGLHLYRDLPAHDKAWVRNWLSGDAVVPERDLNALFSSIVPPRRQPKVFLSHSHADKPFVRALARRLASSGIDYWLDEAEIKTGESLVQRLSDAVMRKVDFVVAVLSPKSVRSRWVREELELAMTRQIKGRRFRVLPVIKAPCKLPPYLEGNPR